MPIKVTDYIWRQTDSTIFVTVPLKGVHPKYAHIYSHDIYIEVNYKPFIFDVFLKYPINNDKSVCVIYENQIVFELIKQEPKYWEYLENNAITKQEAIDLKLKICDEIQQKLQEKHKKNIEKRESLKRLAVQKQMVLDNENRKAIEEMKNLIKKEVMHDLEEIKQNTYCKKFNVDVNDISENKVMIKALDENDGCETKITIENFTKTQKINITRNKENIKASEFIEENNIGDSVKINKYSKDSNVFKNNEENVEDTKNSKLLLANNVIITEKKQTEINNLNIPDNKNFQEKYRATITITGESENTSVIDEEIRSITNDIDINNCEAKAIITKITDKIKQRSVAKKSRAHKTNTTKNDILKQVAIQTIPVPLTLPRKNSKIEISFTPREFPTPSRESRASEEEEWLKKQLNARRCAGFVVEDLTSEEQNPDWLKAKGDEFFKQKNYIGAISAYSHGIKLSEKMASLYVNRSAAHYALNNFHKCLEDCSVALDLLTPPITDNLKWRVRCYARRGAALCKLGLPSKSLTEFKTALVLDPDNQELREDFEMVQKLASNDEENISD